MLDHEYIAAEPHGWAMGPVRCWLCDRRWVAVRPDGVDVLECPGCGLMSGLPDSETWERWKREGIV